MFDAVKDLMKEPLKSIFDSYRNILLFFGIIIVLLAAASGVTYQDYFRIDDPYTRTGLSVLGVALIMLSVWSKGGADDDCIIRKINLDEYNIKITYPTSGSFVDVVDVHGVIAKPLPSGYDIVVVRHYEKSGKFSPYGKVINDHKRNAWWVNDFRIDGNQGDKWRIIAFVAGPSTVAFLQYFQEATRIHNRTMEALYNATSDSGEWLPNLEKITPDMFECHSVKVTRK